MGTCIQQGDLLYPAVLHRSTGNSYLYWYVFLNESEQSNIVCMNIMERKLINDEKRIHHHHRRHRIIIIVTIRASQTSIKIKPTRHQQNIKKKPRQEQQTGMYIRAHIIIATIGTVKTSLKLKCTTWREKPITYLNMYKR